jgi:hypothetical protein
MVMRYYLLIKSWFKFVLHPNSSQALQTKIEGGNDEKDDKHTNNTSTNL